MKKRLCILLAVITLSACANAGIIDYFRDRGADLLDIFLLRISVAHKARAFGAGPALPVWAQIGGIYFEGEHFGMDRRGVGVWRERRKEGGISLLYFSNIENEIIWGNYFLEEGTPWMDFEPRGLVRNDVQWNDGRRHFFSINAEIQPGLIPGLEAGIYPMEIIDFAVGFLTMDTQNDDLARVDKYAPGPAEDDQPLSEESMETLPEDLQTLPENLNTLLESMEPLPHPGPAPVE